MLHIVTIAVQSLIAIGLVYGAYLVMWSGRRESGSH
jgi:hypothetical protein